MLNPSLREKRTQPRPEQRNLPAQHGSAVSRQGNRQDRWEHEQKSKTEARARATHTEARAPVKGNGLDAEFKRLHYARPCIPKLRKHDYDKASPLPPAPQDNPLTQRQDCNPGVKNK